MTPIALDIAVGLIIALSAITAYFRGFVREAFTIGGVALAAFCAHQFGHLLIPEFNNWLHVEEAEEGRMVWGILSPVLAAKVFSYGGVFLLVFIMAALLGYFISQGIRGVGLGIIDRLLGACFGVARGFLFALVLYVPFSYLIGKEQMPVWAKESYSISALDTAFVWTKEKFDLDQYIEKREDGVAVKFDKIKSGDFNALSKEEREKLEKLEKKPKDEKKKKDENDESL